MHMPGQSLNSPTKKGVYGIVARHFCMRQTVHCYFYFYVGGSEFSLFKCDARLACLWSAGHLCYFEQTLH